MCVLTKMQACPGARKYRPLYCILLLGMLVFIYSGIMHIHSPQQHLVVEAPGEEQYLYSIPANNNDVFEMTYLHSVSNRLVQGRFEITGEGDIRPLTTTFDSFGPGLPELDGSLDYEVQNGKFVVYHDEEPREKISLFVSPLTEDRLYWYGQEYDLASHFEKPVLLKIYTSTK